jgi:hypothetical protein
MTTVIPLIPRYFGHSSIDDIVNAINRRRPDLKNAPRMSAEKFAELRRDKDGNIERMQHVAFYNTFSLEQLQSLTQSDKDTIRYSMWIEPVRKAV